MKCAELHAEMEEAECTHECLSYGTCDDCGLEMQEEGLDGDHEVL